MRCLLAVMLALAAGRAWSASTYFQEGIKLMKAERYQEAVVAFEKEAIENPGSAELLMNLGWSYWRLNRIDDAWRCFDLLAKLDPKNASYLRLLAQAEISRKEFPHALEHSKEALRLLPGDKDSSIVMSSALIGLRRHHEAHDILASLVERYPDSAAVQFHMADNLAAMGRLNESLRHFDKLLRLSPEQRDYRRARANVLYALGHVGAAISEWTVLADSVPPDQKAIISLGWAAWKEKDIEAAYKHGARLLQLDEKNPVYLRFVANLQIERGEQLDALRLAQRALDILGRDKDASLIKAKALFNLRRDKEAMAVLTMLLRDFPDNQQIIFHMADFLDGMDRKPEALVFFNRLIKTYPDNMTYRYRRADIHYSLGEFDQAIAEWKRMAERYPAEYKPLQMLADDAISRAAWDEALDFIERLAGRRPLDETTWQRLAKVYQSMKAYPQAIAAAEKAISLAPADQGSWFIKAETLEVMQEYDMAEKTYHQILQRNPNSVRTLSSLARIAEAKGDYARAIRLIQTIRKMAFSDNTSSPYLDILEARLWADWGKIERGMRVLKKKATKKRMSVPVLLYHGVSRFERGDVMSVPRKSFLEQMTAIKAAGYEAISVDELARYWDGKGSLPDKPIMITFDDARADAFVNGDSALKDNDLKATMFVHLAAGFKRSRYYAGLDLLRQWNKTGRWEVQAHSDKAHELVQVDAAGSKGHFLANRIWLPHKRRLETIEEFEQRLDGDFKGARDKLQALFPETKMHSYAFPFGDMGQTDFTNTPEAPAMNWRTVHKYFKFAFTQDAYGFNRVPTKVADLTRYEVKREHTTKDLMRHLVMNEPWVKAKMLEANLWTRTNQPGRALSIYRMLRRSYGVDEAALYSGEATAFEMFGNGHVARKRWGQALDRDPAQYRYRELSAFSKAKDAPRVGTDGRHFSDNFTHNTRVSVRSSAHAKAARVEGFAGRAVYSSMNPQTGGDDRASANEAGARLSWHLLPRVRLDGDFTRRLFQEGARRGTNSGNARVTFPFFAPFRLGVSGGVNDVETRMAIGRGFSVRNYGGSAEWDVLMNTTVLGFYDHLMYSDGNRGRSMAGIVSRRFAERFALGYAFRYGDTSTRVPEYYSPGRTATHTGSISVGDTFGGIDARRNTRLGEGKLTYSAGYGTQDETSRIIHGVKAELSYRFFSSLSANAFAGYTQSPAYISRQVGLGVGVDF